MEVSKVDLGKGYIDIYNFGDIKLHCYQTNDFENKVKAQYPEYSGLNYLDMTSGMFFSQN